MQCKNCISDHFLSSLTRIITQNLFFFKETQGTVRNCISVCAKYQNKF